MFLEPQNVVALRTRAWAICRGTSSVTHREVSILCVLESSGNEVLTDVEVDFEVWDEVGDRLEEVQDVSGPPRLGLLPFDRKDLSISASKPSQKGPSIWHPRKER